jgi:GNAT superfamily N-acetyltransferase
MSTGHIQLRALAEEGSITIPRAFEEQGDDKPGSLYRHYLKLQGSKELEPIIAEVDGNFAGYLAIKWKSGYLPFLEKGIPEIVDFNVLHKYQRKGIGTALMDEAEQRIKRVSPLVGIGFGVFQDYGAAQILYVKRGYIPDETGIGKDSKPIAFGEQIVVDHSIVFHLVKELD